MLKKIVIAGLLITLFVQKCKHIEDLKKNKKKLPINALDDLLNKSGLVLGGTRYDPFTIRINLKGLMHAAGIIDD